MSFALTVSPIIYIEYGDDGGVLMKHSVSSQEGGVRMSPYKFILTAATRKKMRECLVELAFKNNLTFYIEYPFGKLKIPMVFEVYSLSRRKTQTMSPANDDYLIFFEIKTGIHQVYQG